MGSLNKRRGCSSRTILMLSLELFVLVFALYRFKDSLFPSNDTPTTEQPTPSTETGTTPQGLTRRDVLPTPTIDNTIPPRYITFPGAQMSAPIVPAGRVGGTWETRHLGDSVGWLVGTSWLDGPGGNIVLAGHVESATGEPGPFAYLFEAKAGDLVILKDGTREERYVVTMIEEASPNDVAYVAQDGRSRLTLITCTDWDYEQKTYHGRLIVIAEPSQP
ncbi:MAG TPA: class F sortase [Aggregatilineaceae bacterium]|nr:class F sortase [Aggregatilineaceae bacterium]